MPAANQPWATGPRGFLIPRDTSGRLRRVWNRQTNSKETNAWEASSTNQLPNQSRSENSDRIRPRVLTHTDRHQRTPINDFPQQQLAVLACETRAR